MAQSVGNYNLVGCVVDTVGARALSNYTFTSSTLSVENCVGACQAKGYAKAGMEFANQCYCGDSVAVTATTAPIADCMKLFCTGNSMEFCGAASRLLVYST
jgi:hypothetical protein